MCYMLIEYIFCYRQTCLKVKEEETFKCLLEASLGPYTCLKQEPRPGYSFPDIGINNKFKNLAKRGYNTVHSVLGCL